MPIYIALLRGINVGGKNSIKMTDLRRTLEAMGLEAVQTYIQSGNALFRSSEDEEPLRQKLEQEIEKAFGFTVKVALRTATELERVANSCPFSKDEIEKAESTAVGESLYVAFLTQEPSTEKIERFGAYRSEGDDYRVEGREVYLLFGNSIRNSRLTNNLTRLDDSATVRNWKTLGKLVGLARAIEVRSLDYDQTCNAPV